MTESFTAYDANHYVQRLDLGADPFDDRFESDYFYTGGERQQLCDQLTEFGQIGGQVALLVGVTGCGTSEVLDRSLVGLQDIMDCCYLDAEEEPDPDQVLALLADQLCYHPGPPNIPLASQDAAINLVDFLGILDANIDAGGTETILIAVDQAHFLSLESLQLLLSLANSTDNRLRLVLVGEYQLEELVELAGYDLEQFKRWELLPLSAEESGEYLLGLLQTVGYAGEQPFSQQQLRDLQLRSAGSCWQLEQLAAQLLLTLHSENASASSSILPTPHRVAIALVVIVLLGIGLYWQPGSQEPAPADAKPAQTATASSPAPLMTLPPVIEQGKGANNAPDLPESGESIDALQTAEVNATLAVEQQPKDELLEDALLKDELLKDEPPEEAPLEKAAASEPLPVLAEASKPKPPANNFSEHEKRLLSYPSSSYMLQLLGSVNESSAKAFADLYSDSVTMMYFKTQRNNSPWYVVVTGPYNSLQAARDAIKTLPKGLQEQKPWAKSLADIQSRIGS